MKQAAPAAWPGTGSGSWLCPPGRVTYSILGYTPADVSEEVDMSFFGARAVLRIIGVALAAVAISQIAHGICNARATLKENQGRTEAKRDRPSTLSV
jgi:hypothetical protein